MATETFGRGRNITACGRWGGIQLLIHGQQWLGVRPRKALEICSSHFGLGIAKPDEE